MHIQTEIEKPLEERFGRLVGYCTSDLRIGDCYITFLRGLSIIIGIDIEYKRMQILTSSSKIVILVIDPSHPLGYEEEQFVKSRLLVPPPSKK